MRRSVAPEDVMARYDEGVDAVVEVASRLDSAGWGRPACGEWSATDTARHLLAVSRWYHHWLDRALLGEVSRPFPGADVAEHNRRALADLEGLAGPEAIVAFRASAQDYLARAAAHWTAPFAYPFGAVTVGLHCGVAATEWHLHAWDLSAIAGPRLAPADPQGLFLAAGACVARAEGGFKGAVLERLVPLVSKRSPWERLLERSGRTPTD